MYMNTDYRPSPSKLDINTVLGSSSQFDHCGSQHRQSMGQYGDSSYKILPDDCYANLTPRKMKEVGW